MKDKPQTSRHDWKPTTSTHAASRCANCGLLGFSPHSLPVFGCEGRELKPDPKLQDWSAL